MPAKRENLSNPFRRSEMPDQKSPITIEEFDHFDIDAFFQQIERNEAAKKLRRERPWTYDIIRVLWGSRSWISMDQLCTELWSLRNPSGISMPKEFNATVQSTLNHHTSQSSVFKNKNKKPEDDLFLSPKGKGSGTWALRDRERAMLWLKKHDLNPV
jgi:hypothetical protein